MNATTSVRPRLRHASAVLATPRDCYEWQGFAPAPRCLGAGADDAGRVTRHDDGRILTLHHSPNRWLLPQADPALVATLGAAGDAGVLSEVNGKWREILLPGAASASDPVHPVRASFACDLVLARRDCAALWLFDCPLVIARDARDLTLWLEASFEASFRASLRLLGVTVE